MCMISKILAADKAKFSISAIGKLYQYFYQCLHIHYWVDLLHCLVVTILHCVDEINFVVDYGL